MMNIRKIMPTTYKYEPTVIPSAELASMPPTNFTENKSTLTGG
jgi:hypothetical protein